MLVNDYFAQVEHALAQRADVILRQSIHVEARTDTTGLIRGLLVLDDNSEFHFVEYVDTEQGFRRLRYHYHYQYADGRMILRYDDKPHYPEVTTFPHHKHVAQEDRVAASSAPTLIETLDEVIEMALRQNR
jgi:hypothetical protein